MKTLTKILLFLMLMFIGCGTTDSPQSSLNETKSLEKSIINCIAKINRYKAINESILIDYPESKAAAEACFNLAKLNETFSHFETAGEYYRKLLENYPESKLCPEALYKLAVISHLHLKKTDEAIKYFYQLQNLYPDSRQAEQSYLDLAELFLQSKKAMKAIQVYQEFLENYPGHVLNDEIYFRIGKIYQLEVKDSTDARVAFQQLVAKFPASPWAKAAKKELGDHKGDKND